MGPLLGLSHLVLLPLIERVEDKDPFQIPFLLFIPIERKEFNPVKFFPLQGLKKRPGKVQLFKTC